MKKLSADSLMTLEAYEERREEFRRQVMRLKKKRMVHVGEHVTIHFENYLSMHYQVQEVLRAERIFQRAAIEEELGAYNPLIPDGSNWKATMMIEFSDAEQRRERLRHLIGIDRQTWIRVAGCETVYAISDEDLQRSDKDKTSAVHFLRFELSAEMLRSAKQNAAIRLGIAHKSYQAELELSEDTRLSLLDDLD